MVLAWILSLALAQTPAPATSYLMEDQPCRWRLEKLPELRVGEQGQIQFRLNVPPEHHVLREAVEISVVHAGGLVVGQVRYPPAITKVDPDFGPQEEYHEDVLVSIPITAPSMSSAPLELVVELRHQGCSVDTCHPPREATEKVRIPVTLRPAEKK